MSEATSEEDDLLRMKSEMRKSPWLLVAHPQNGASVFVPAGSRDEAIAMVRSDFFGFDENVRTLFEIAPMRLSEDIPRTEVKPYYTKLHETDRHRDEGSPLTVGDLRRLLAESDLNDEFPVVVGGRDWDDHSKMLVGLADDTWTDNEGQFGGRLCIAAMHLGLVEQDS